MDSDECGRSAADEIAAAIATELAEKLRKQRKYAVMHPTKVDSDHRDDLITLCWAEGVMDKWTKSKTCFVACSVMGGHIVVTAMHDLTEDETWVALEDGDFIKTILVWLAGWLRSLGQRRRQRYARTRRTT